MDYIAYGSNHNIEQMKRRCPNSKLICKGIVRGYKLVFNYHADIIPTGDEEDFVPVTIWKIANEDWKALDKYEGFPKYYVKEKIKTEYQISKLKTEKRNCTAYVMAENQKGFSMPSENYFNIIEDGYKENHIDLAPLYDALYYTYYQEKKIEEEAEV